MERIEFHPMPPEPDKYQTPAAKLEEKKKKRQEQEEKGWEEVNLEGKAALDAAADADEEDIAA